MGSKWVILLPSVSVLLIPGVKRQPACGGREKFSMIQSLGTKQYIVTAHNFMATHPVVIELF